MTATPPSEPHRLPGANTVLTQLQQLRQTTRSVAEQELLLTRDLRKQRFALQRQRETSEQSQQDQLHTALAELNAAYDAESAKYQSRYDHRRKRVEQLANTTKRNLPKRVEEERSRYLGRLQWRRRKAEARHQADQAAFQNELASWNALLEEENRRLQVIERHAQRSFSPYGPLRQLLRPSPQDLPTSPAIPIDARSRLIEELRSQIDRADACLRAYLKLPLPAVFRSLPPAGFGLMAVVLGSLATFLTGLHTTGYIVGGVIVATLTVLSLLLHQIAGRQGMPEAQATATALHAARLNQNTLSASFDTQLQQEKQRLDTALQTELTAVQEAWDKVDEVGSQFEKRAREKLENQPPRLLALIERGRQRRLQRVENGRTEHSAELESETRERLQFADHQIQIALADLDAQEDAHIADLAQRWHTEVLPLHAQLKHLHASPEAAPLHWNPETIQTWKPPHQFPATIRVGQLEIELDTDDAALPDHPTLQLAGSNQLALPLALSFPHQGCLLIESDDSCPAAITGVMNQTILRILSSSPAGKVTFTILDPVGLGQNFAGLMHLADYEESLINRRIWTQRDQIDERLAELSEHIEKVIQMYLRNEYETITDYNAQAGSVAEKYHFLVIADFPANFSETAAQRLQSIAVSGPRCGVFTLMHWNRKQPAPDGFLPDELRLNSLRLQYSPKNGFTLNDDLTAAGGRVSIDSPPPDASTLALVQRIGQASIDSNRVEVPFAEIAPAPADLWTDSTTRELRVPIGRTGATKFQYLAIGKGTRQHALFAGKTGSGKSTLFHVIITNLALHCSPDEVEFYLIDFKKGVEFKAYADAQLPHARVIAIESDREFGLSVLQRVDEELKRRGDLFRKIGAQDVAGYKKNGGTEPMPRSLLIIDEFQEFFTEDDVVAQNASVLFDRIVRQGRAFGIHVLLGSQTLGGAYTLARATLGQMVIRVALQCNEADAYLIMDENNPAPRLLTRPGEGIYNDAAGAVEGNSPFQVVWLGDDERDRYLHQIHDLAVTRSIGREPPIVFEGNAPAEVASNHLLAKALAARPTSVPAQPTIWLGAPNSIKGPTEARFIRQSGNHLLLVGQREETLLCLHALGLIALAAQHPVGAAKFVFFHGAAPGTSDADYLAKLFPLIPHGVSVAHVNEVEKTMADLNDELQRRSNAAAADAPPVFIFVHGLHKFKKLRNDDEFDFSMGSDDAPKPGALFNTLITEGSALGMHLIVSLDNYNNVARCLSRKAVSEFEMRVIFQMSANDSASLIETTLGANLGLHRAIFHNEQQGTDETFRPYALPGAAWINEATAQLTN